MWSELHKGANTLVDPSLLVTLDAHVGDTLVLGFHVFRIIGTLRTVPGDPGVTAAIGPRVIIPMSELEATQLLEFGSRAQYEAMLKLRNDQNPQRTLPTSGSSSIPAAFEGGPRRRRRSTSPTQSTSWRASSASWG